jgi:hypothetical protein
MRDRDLVRLAREDGARPGRRRRRDDRPVDLKAGDEVERGPVRLGACPVGAGDLVGILPGEQGRVVARDGEPGRAAPEGGCHPVEEPARCDVEGLGRRMGEARQRGLVVGEQRGHERGTRLVGLRRDRAGEWRRIEGGRHHELLALLQAEPNPDGNLGQPLEPLGVGRAGLVPVGKRHRNLVVGVPLRSAAARAPASPGRKGAQAERKRSIPSEPGTSTRRLRRRM